MSVLPFLVAFTALTGRFPAEAKEIPKKLEISIRPETTAACEIRGRAWQCPVPSGRLDVKLIPEGFAPRYLWAIEVVDGKTHEVGMIELRRGASVSGWVVLPNGDPPAGEAAVELRPQVFASAAEPPGRSATRTLAAKATPRGFFQLHGVPPGVYDLTARVPGWSPARSEGVKVTEAREYVIPRPVAFEPLARLDVTIDPPAAADQQPWIIALGRAMPRSKYTEPVTRAAASVDGRWSREGLERGQYLLIVQNAAGAAMQTTPIDVAPYAPPVTIRLPLVLVRGRVHTDSEPLAAAMLDFESSTGGRVSVRSNEEGRFSGTLPGEGKYRVRIHEPKGRAYVVRRGVEVDRPDGAGHASLDLDLGLGGVTGRVTDEQGQPVQSDVMLLREGSPEANASTDEDGEFEMIGIASGSVHLRAMTRTSDSGLVPVGVSDVLNPAITLVLHRPERVRGTLLSVAGDPIAGALIRFFAPTLPGPREAVSDPAGEFELPVPRGTPVVTVAVLAMGAPIKVMAVPAGSDAVRLVLADRGGSIFVPMTRQTPSPWIQAPGAMPFPMTQLIFPRDGSSFPRGVLPDGMSIELEPGVYSVCSDPHNGDARCRTVQVAPGTDTRLEAPAVPAANGG